ncbi:MAG: ABC transporter ATP-binding protein [Clostridia bacterium]|nr:ABC transporter ATP-binding protein [Clostridia bacterium]
MHLQAKGITKDYFRKGRGTNVFTALHPTDLNVDGGITVVVGKSGSGKSTLLNVLSGVLSPTEGTVLWDGEDIYALSDKTLSCLRNAKVGIVPQGQTGLQSLTVKENVLVPFYLSENKDKQASALAESRADELLEKVGVSHLSDSYPNELSGGELRRMAIARALLNRPEVLFADEPTGDLDEENTALILRLFREIADQGTAVVMVTHDRDSLSYADKIYSMSSGVLTVESISEI